LTATARVTLACTNGKCNTTEERTVALVKDKVPMCTRCGFPMNVLSAGVRRKLPVPIALESRPPPTVNQRRGRK
jgi:hypothetical protein